MGVDLHGGAFASGANERSVNEFAFGVGMSCADGRFAPEAGVLGGTAELVHRSFTEVVHLLFTWGRSADRC
jgi:hypothetical protein